MGLEGYRLSCDEEAPGRRGGHRQAAVSRGASGRWRREAPPLLVQEASRERVSNIDLFCIWAGPLHDDTPVVFRKLSPLI
jgi:hypothetical protein